jgi:hypothetical protein
VRNPGGRESAGDTWGNARFHDICVSGLSIHRSLIWEIKPERFLRSFCWKLLSARYPGTERVLALSRHKIVRLEGSDAIQKDQCRTDRSGR